MMINWLLPIVLLVPLSILFYPGLSVERGRMLAKLSLFILVGWLIGAACWTWPYEAASGGPVLVWTALMGGIAGMTWLLGRRVSFLLPLYLWGGASLVWLNEGFTPSYRLWMLGWVASMMWNLRTRESNKRWLTPTGILSIGIWFGLLTSAAEHGWRLLREQLVDPMAMMNADDLFTGNPPVTFWAATLMNLVAFGIFALVLAYVGWRWPDALSPRSVVFFFALAAGLSMTMMLIYFVPAPVQIVVGILVAYRVSRLASDHWEGFLKVVRLSQAWLIGGLISLALIAQINALGTKSRQLANRPAAQADAPNVLLIVMDTVRPQSLSLCGYERSTSPELEKLAQKGVLFPQALTACSWTLPSHATLFTGQPQNLHRADFDRALDKTYPTLAECLRDSGYSSCGVVANFGCCGLISGLSRGFDEYVHFKSLKVMYKYASFMARYIFGMTEDHEMLAPEVNDNFLAWLDKRDTNRPFFGFLNYLDAHTPYCVPDPAFDRFTDLDPALRTRFRQRWAFEGEADGIEQRADPVEMTLAKDTYDGSIAYLSYHIGQLMDALEARGVLDNTLVVITNDHGEAFGEHGTWEHAKTMYRTEIQSFMLLFGPGVRSGVVLDIPVSHSDVARTILDLVSGKPRENLGGVSFAGLSSVDESRTGRGSPLVYSQINLISHRIQSLVIEGFHFIHNSNGVEPDKLFDYNSDPAEQHDLAASAVGERWLPIFRQQLHSFTGETTGNPTGDSRSSPAVTQWWTEGLCFRGSHTVCRCGRAPMTRWQYDRYLKR